METRAQPRPHPPAPPRSSRPPVLWRRVVADMRAWCGERWWWWRLPVLAYLIYAGVRHLVDGEYSSVFFGLTFIIHEIGHLVTGWWAPVLLGVAAGSIAQTAAPIGAAVVFWRQRDYFGVAVAGCWLAFASFHMSLYMADATALDLPMVVVGEGEAIHDWNYMFGRFGLLAWDRTIAGWTFAGSALLWALCVAWAAWLCAEMMWQQTRRWWRREELR